MSTGRGEAKNVEDEGGGSRHDKGIKESPGFEAFEGWVSMERPTCHASHPLLHIKFALLIGTTKQFMSPRQMKKNSPRHVNSLNVRQQARNTCINGIDDFGILMCPIS